MTLRLYLDDCAFSRRLYDILSGDPYNHEVLTPLDTHLLGARDEQHFLYAQRHGLSIVTRDPDDFEALHQAHPEHPGIFAIYQDNDRRDMSFQEIARAIQNIVDAGVPIAGQFHVLNHWRF